MQITSERLYAITKSDSQANGGSGFKFQISGFRLGVFLQEVVRENTH